MDEPPADRNALYDVLSSGRRRYTLYRLQEHLSMTLADLADDVAVWERERGIEEIDAEAVKRVYVSLYHCHVPRMADADLVRYDQERDLVSLTDAGRDVEVSIAEPADSIV